MTKAESIAVFEDMKATFADAVCSVAIRMSDNQTVTVEGLRSNQTTSRAQANKSYSENVDMNVIAPVSAFTDLKVLRGKSAVVTYQGLNTSVRLLATRAHALGGLVVLIFGDYDKVTQ
jgi:hypothetical protein